MSVEDAFRFLQKARVDPTLQARLNALGPVVSAHTLLEVAAAAGFVFTEADLQLAFRRDWAMRWLRYYPASQPGTAPAPTR
jgi:predicted ribosomally synthesized peptide with nif11-like leader